MAYIYDLTDTWSAGGTVFNAIKMNVTDSASAVASKLVSLQTNGTEHFSVTKAGAGYFSGNVGIGVTPLANTRISVRTATVTDTAYYADNGVNSGFKVKFASSLTSILNDFGADLVLGTNDTERMRINAVGNVGVGTNSPAGKLHVSGAEVRLQGSASFYSFYDTAGTTRSGYIQNNAGSIALVGELAQPMTFWTTNAERMRIDSSGNVGIGTSSITPIFGRTLQISDGTVNSSISLIGTGAGTTGDGYIAATVDAFGITARASTPLTFGSNDTERMRIDASGNVGIGTSSPLAGYRVDVAGSVNSSASFVSGGGTANQAQIGNKVLLFYNTSVSEGFIQSADDTSTFNSMGFSKATLRFLTSNAEQMRIDASGNVGIGTTSPQQKFVVSNAGAGGIEIIPTGVIQSYNRSGGAYQALNYDAAIHAFRIGVSEAMRIDASGNLLVGTTSALSKFTVQQAADGYDQGISLSRVGADRGTIFLNATGNTMNFGRGTATSMSIDASGNVGIGSSSQIIFTNKELNVNAASGSAGFALATAGAARLYLTGTSTEGNVTTKGAIPLLFGTNETERMRIDTSGNLLVGTTSTGSLSGDCFLYSPVSSNIALGHSTSIVSGTNYIGFLYNGSTIGSITQSGTTAVLYNTSSDVRLKHDIVDAPEASSLIDAIQVRSFKWNADDSEQRYGFVAQELLEVAPEAVSQPEDPEEMMGVDYSKLVPMLVKELQSLRARVAQLEGN